MRGAVRGAERFAFHGSSCVIALRLFSGLAAINPHGLTPVSVRLWMVVPPLRSNHLSMLMIVLQQRAWERCIM